MNRRELLILSAASAVAVVAVPNIPFASQTAVASVRLPAWVVGTPGEYDWQFVRAATEFGAKGEWLKSSRGIDCCAAPGPECECEFCTEMRGLAVTRQPEWDSVSTEPKPADWLRAGLGHCCDRCGSETHLECDGHAIGDEAVCDDCMELADWKIANPERHAEMLADLADEEAA